jgi:hypothetical protein
MVGKLLTTALAVIEHPLLLVYVMVAVPADAPVITPEEVMLATALLLVAHGVVVAAVPEPVSVHVSTKQTKS